MFKYLNGERVQVIQHNMIWLWQKCWFTKINIWIIKNDLQ
jgi:hypothetical protein